MLVKDSLTPYICPVTGHWLEQGRKAAGLSQRQLGAIVGCSGSYIDLLENDGIEKKSGKQIQPNIDLIDRIARALKISVWDARKAAGFIPERKGSRDYGPIIEYLDDLPDDQRDWLFEIIELSWRRNQAK